MDIHRARFVRYPPSAINALAFSYSNKREFTGKGTRYVRLAVGRANGNIEIWDPANGAWVHEITLSGGKDRSVEGLAWIQEPDEEDENGYHTDGRLRLFSIGYSSTVTEWNLVTGLPLRHSSGNHSEVWSLAAQPKYRTNTKSREGDFRGQNLVAGCADGTLALLSTADDDLRFQKFLTRPTARKSRVLSVVWQNRDVVVAGFADSAIRVFDTRNGALLRNISLGAPSLGGPREILVWTVKCLPNGNIVAGDSTGEIRFYDGKNYSQTQRISAHEADVLDIAVSQDGETIFSGGMDKRTVAYNLSRGHHGHRRWAKIAHRRYHDHDVKTMATYETKQMSVMVSGGLDTHPIIVPIREFDTEHSRTLPALPQSPPVTSAPRARLLVSWWDREVRIWRVKKRDGSNETPKLVARLALKGEDNVNSASISEDGSLLAVSTASGVKVFQLSSRKSENERGLRVRKLGTPPLAEGTGARLVQLSPNGKWLAMVTHESEICLARLVDEEDGRWKLVPRVVELHRLHKKHEHQNALNGYWGSYDRIITRIALSDDVLVASDIGGYVESWVVEGNEDVTAPEVDWPETEATGNASSDDEDDEDEDESRPVVFYGQHWIRNPAGHLLPKLDSSALVLSFRPTDNAESQANGNPAVHPTRSNPHAHSHKLPSGDRRLLVVTAQHQIYEFDVLQGRLTDWSRRNPSSGFPSEFRGIRDRAMGCLWDHDERRQRLWLYGSNWVFMFDLTADLCKRPAGEVADGVTDGTAETPMKKRKRGPDEDPLRQSASGAGSKMPARELEGAGRKYRKITGADASSWVSVDKARSSSVTAADGEAEDDAEEEEQQQEENSTTTAALALLRRGASDSNVDEADDAQTGPQKRTHWHTFKYRPILGLVAISHPDDRRAEKGGKADAPARPLEVVLVERPSWDLDLPPKFVGVHER
ncbi:quinon protein alcohol dehydrogenase-like superfamily [Phyllosticta capitalensis]